MMVDSGLSTYINFMLQIIATVLLHKFVAVSLACFTRDALNIQYEQSNHLYSIKVHFSFNITTLHYPKCVTLFNCGQCCDEYLYPKLAVSTFLDAFVVCCFISQGTDVASNLIITA